MAHAVRLTYYIPIYHCRMPSFGVGAADQYLAIIDTVVAFSVVYPRLGAMTSESGLAVSTSVDLAHVEFDLRVHYSIIQSYASFVHSCVWLDARSKAHKTYPLHNPPHLYQ